MKKLINGLALSMLLLTGCKSGISDSSSNSSYYNSILSSESNIVSTSESNIISTSESTSSQIEISKEELIEFINNLDFNDEVFTFDGKEHSILINEELLYGIKVQYENNNNINVGEYEVVAKFMNINNDFIIDRKATMNIIEGGLPGVSFQDQTFYYTGEAFYMEITGELPEGVGVSYVGNGQTEVGTYTVIAHFVDITGNYYVPDLEATMTIEPESKHTVTLVKNNGEEDSTRTIRHGKTFDEPEYEMQYYVIEGWYTDPECEKGRWDFETDIVTEDITLYAKWEVDVENWIWRLARIASKSTIMLFVTTYDSNGGESERFGSGVVIAKEIDETDGKEYYYALTNNHIVVAQNNHGIMVNYESRVIHVYDHYQNIYYDAEVLAESNKYDLALIRFDTTWEVESIAGAFADPNYENGEYAVRVAEFAGENPKVGLDVCSYGSPIAQQGVNTIGTITQYDGGCIYEGENSVSCITDFDVIHHTASILEGNSGGPLFGPDLKLVGINYGSGGLNSTFETSRDFWAVPISEVRNFIDKFITDNKDYKYGDAHDFLGEL